MARKPFNGTVAANVREHGCGPINIDGCRVEGVMPKACRGTGWAAQDKMNAEHGFRPKAYYSEQEGVDYIPSPKGRWPANVIHDGSDEVLDAFPAQSSVTGRRTIESQVAEVEGTEWLMSNHKSTEYTDSGSPSRFFYCAKASKADRAGSKHPTVKPVALMRYLVRLITPPGGTVLDPFAGTGTTGQAATDEGFDAVLIEREAEYCDDIRRRLDLPNHTSA